MLLCLSFFQEHLPKAFLYGDPYIKGLLIFVVSVSVLIPTSIITEKLIERPFNRVGYLLGNKVAGLGNA
jgi:peptidoglycan/LPS O-acetylase OafA/YrhL